MDATDKKILHLLYQQADVTTATLVPYFGISRAALNRRIAVLKRRGIIQRFSIFTNRNILGKPQVSYVLISLDKSFSKELFINMIANDYDILECYSVFGEYDCILKICTKDIDALYGKIKHLKEYGGVVKSHTMICTEENKFSPFVLPDPTES